MMVILALALIVLGPEKLPQVARQVARFIKELKRASEDCKKEVDLDKRDELKKPLKLDKVLGEDLSDIVKKKNLVEPDFLKAGSRNGSSGPGGLGPEWKEAKGRAAGAAPSSGAGAEPASAGQAESRMEDQPDSRDEGR